MPSEADLYEAFYVGDPEPIADFLLWVADSYGLSGELSVLDMGCGPGRMLETLTEKGWRVVGMEPDPAFSDVAAERASTLDKAEVRAGGFLDLDEEAEYDLIVAINDPLSHLLTASERSDALARCNRALRRGGILFVDIPNFKWILQNYREPPVLTGDAQGATVTRRSRHDIDLHNDLWTHVDDYEIDLADGTRSEAAKTYVMAMVGYPELEGALINAEFAEIRTFNSYSAREVERLTGPRIMASALAVASA